jgi:hypothetical protein
MDIKATAVAASIHTQLRSFTWWRIGRALRFSTRRQVHERPLGPDRAALPGHGARATGRHPRREQLEQLSTDIGPLRRGVKGHLEVVSEALGVEADAAWGTRGARQRVSVCTRRRLGHARRRYRPDLYILASWGQDLAFEELMDEFGGVACQSVVSILAWRVCAGQWCVRDAVQQEYHPRMPLNKPHQAQHFQLYAPSRH